MLKKKRDFIDLKDFNKDELEKILRLADDIKSKKDNIKYLQDKNLGLLFSVPSTRTRISFQVGVKELGGDAEYYNFNDLQLANHEDLNDTAKVMERYLDALIVRSYDMNLYGQGRETLMKLANSCDIPVINALDCKDHPCQVMGDILTLKERFGSDYKKKRVVFTWGYSKRQKSLGVPHSLMTAGSILGMDIVFAYPKGFELDQEYVDFAIKESEKSGAKIQFSNDLMEASEGADVIYQKNWKSINLSTEEDFILREQVKGDWCVSKEHFSVANTDAIYMDCLPVIRGEGVTADVLDGEQSIVFDQAENRLHIQKAILATLI